MNTHLLPATLSSLSSSSGKQFRVSNIQNNSNRLAGNSVPRSDPPVMDINSLQQYHSYKCQICPFYAPDQETVANHFQMCHAVEQQIAIESLRNSLLASTAQSLSGSHSQNGNSQNNHSSNSHDISHSNAANVTLTGNDSASNSNTANPSEDKQYKCGACDYTTYKRGNLNAHFVGKHTMERPFPCPHCEYRAKTERHLQAHILTHGGDTPPFRCNQCNYETDDRTDLVRHKDEVHDSDKVFSCEHCPYKARTSDYLAKHRVTQHTPMEERQYECQHCSKRFAIESLLRRHLKKHLDNTRYQCPYCANMFKDIRRHRTRCTKAPPGAVMNALPIPVKTETAPTKKSKKKKSANNLGQVHHHLSSGIPAHQMQQMQQPQSQQHLNQVLAQTSSIPAASTSTVSSSLNHVANTAASQLIQPNHVINTMQQMGGPIRTSLLQPGQDHRQTSEVGAMSGVGMGMGVLSNRAQGTVPNVNVGHVNDVGNVLPSTLLQYSSAVLTECLSGMFSSIQGAAGGYAGKPAASQLQSVPVSTIIPSTVIANPVGSSLHYVTANVSAGSLNLTGANVPRSSANPMVAGGLNMSHENILASTNQLRANGS